MKRGKIIQLPNDGRTGNKILLSTWPVTIDIEGVKDRETAITLITELTTQTTQHFKSRVAAMKAMRLPYFMLQRHKLPFLYFRNTEMGAFIFKFERSAQ